MQVRQSVRSPLHKGTVVVLACSLVPASALSQTAEECTEGTVIFATDARLTRAAPMLKPGVLFSDGGGFAEHGADEPCDPGKSLGPFEVDAGGEMVLRLDGSPAVPPVWSLYNSGVGISVQFEPKIGSGYGPAQSVLQAALAAEETHTEIGGSWSGPGRITAFVGAPRGSGPLTGSCFGQSYSAVAEIVAVEANAAVAPGQVIRPGDEIATGPNGTVRILGSNLVIGPASSARWEPAVEAPRSDGYVPHPGIATEPGYFTGLRDPNFSEKQEMWVGLQGLVRAMQSAGFDVPSPESMTGVSVGTLTEAYDRIKKLQNGCEAAHALTLFLQSRSDAVREIWPKAAADVALVWLLPNNYKLADLTIRGALRALGKKLTKALPGLAQAELAENLMSTADLLIKNLYTGTDAAQRGRWGLAVFETAMAEKWSPERIADEGRMRQDRAKKLLAEIEDIPNTADEAVAGLEERVMPVMKAIEADLERENERISARLAEEIAAIERDRAEWRSELARFRALQNQNPDMLPGSDSGVMDTPDAPPPAFKWVKVGSEEESAWLEADFQSRRGAANSRAWLDRRTAELKAGALKLPVNAGAEVAKLAIIHSAKMVIENNLREMAKLESEIAALSKHAMPVATGNCVKKKEEPPPCPPKRLKILGGGLRYWTPPFLRGILPDGNPVENPRSGFLGVNVISVDLDGFLVVPDGTDFGVTKTETGGLVTVYDGRVTIQAPDGRLGIVEAGQVVSIPDGTVTELPPEQAAPPELNGLPMTSIPIDANLPEPAGSYPLTLDGGQTGNGWLWQDPGGDVTLAADPDGAVTVTVPDGNEIWGGRADGPRLLHKVTGDFDLSLTLNMATPGAADHFAFTEFILYAPGQQAGFLAKQASAPNAPGADIRLMGGGWARFEGKSRLTVWNDKEGFEPADDAEVRLRFRRRGDLFTGEWSLDGENWTLATRERLDLPETLWTGLGFKRLAFDGQPDVAAVNTIREMMLTGARPGDLATDPVLTVQGKGRVRTLSDGWLIEHDAEKAGILGVTLSGPLAGDFDAVLRVDLGVVPEDAPGGGVALYAAGASLSDWAYVALSTSARQGGGRFQTHQSVAGATNPYAWTATKARSGWLRMIRRDGVIAASYWELGRWRPLDTHGTRQEEPLFLGVTSWNTWDSPGPMAFTPAVAIERLVTGEEVGADYEPEGYSILTEEPMPAGFAPPPGINARLFTAPYPVQAPFFDAEGRLYLLPAERDTGQLMRLDPDGSSAAALEGEAFRGLNRKRGLWQDGMLYVTVDGWSDGGNGNWGLLRVAADGTFEQIAFDTGLGGLACLRPLRDGRILQCDFETDGLWVGSVKGGELTNLSGQELACPQDAAESGASGAIYAVNNGASYSCNGRPGLYRVPPGGGTPELLLAPEGEREFGGIVWTGGGLFGGGLLMADPNRGAILRFDERRGDATPVVAGLDGPGDMAAMPDGSALALLLGERQVLLLQTEPGQPVAALQPAGPAQVPSKNGDKVLQGTAPLAGPTQPSAPQPAPPEAVTTEPPAVFIPVTPAPPPQPVWEPYGPIVTGSLDTIAAVENGPREPSEFRIEEPMLVVSIMTYHWNHGRGDTADTIGLVNEAGDLVGRWAAEGSEGQGGVPNAYWHVYPKLVIPAGLYRITDGRPETWATNGETGYRGIFRIELQRVHDVGAAEVQR